MLSINRRCIALSCLLLGSPATMLGSELCVNVIDETDSSLANAWINITRLVKTSTNDVGATYHAMTDSHGRACVSVSEGVFSVEVGLMGFLNVRYQPVRVMHPYRRQLNYRLPAGETGEGGVEVDAVLTGILASAGKP